MIKLTEYIIEKPLVEIQYPCLMRHEIEDWIILVISENEGVWLNGEYKGKYTDVLELNNFTLINYPITLENQF